MNKQRFLRSVWNYYVPPTLKPFLIEHRTDFPHLDALPNFELKPETYFDCLYLDFIQVCERVNTRGNSYPFAVFKINKSEDFLIWYAKLVSHNNISYLHKTLLSKLFVKTTDSMFYKMTLRDGYYRFIRADASEDSDLTPVLISHDNAYFNLKAGDLIVC